MRFILIIILLALLALVLQLFLAWWTCAIAAFFVGAGIRQSGSSAFWAGFWAIFLLWGGYALWIDQHTQSLLTTKMAQLFNLPSPFFMVLLTAFIGGLTSGFAAGAGAYLRKTFQ
jgi:hypothetical protein